MFLRDSDYLGEGEWGKRDRKKQKQKLQHAILTRPDRSLSRQIPIVKGKDLFTVCNYEYSMESDYSMESNHVREAVDAMNAAILEPNGELWYRVFLQFYHAPPF